MNEEGQTSGMDRLRSTKTIREILEVATSFEKSAWDFYAALAPKVSKRIRYLVEELAEEEQGHYEMFGALADRPDIEQYLCDEIRVPTEDHKFSDFVQIPEIGENPDDQTVLQYALSREDAAMKHYRELAEETAPGPIHDLFEFLANEEAKHKQELEKTYYETVYSGGV
ncbi:MAG: ferritin family protein [Pseudomonadota bacterium]|nr:ferritin family protein [Pseudomonadota bacterium]